MQHDEKQHERQDERQRIDAATSGMHGRGPLRFDVFDDSPARQRTARHAGGFRPSDDPVRNGFRRVRPPDASSENRPPRAKIERERRT
jgi:hypothetical protein